LKLGDWREHHGILEEANNLVGMNMEDVG